MQRRKFLVGMGSLAAGGAATLGTGAYSNVKANRAFEVTIAKDSEALLSLEPYPGPNGEYAFVYTSGQGDLEINLADAPHTSTGIGVNPLAVTQVDQIFQITNEGTQEVKVEVEKTALSVSSTDNLDQDISDSTLHNDILTFYVGDNPSNDRIEAGTSTDQILDVGEDVGDGVEIDLTTVGSSQQPGKLIDDGLGNLPVKALET